MPNQSSKRSRKGAPSSSSQPPETFPGTVKVPSGSPTVNEPLPAPDRPETRDSQRLLRWLLWVSLLGVLLVGAPPSGENDVLARALILAIAFATITLMVRFAVRESQQRQLLVQTLTDLRVSEERYRQITNQANDAIYILDS